MGGGEVKYVMSASALIAAILLGCAQNPDNALNHLSNTGHFPQTGWKDEFPRPVSGKFSITPLSGTPQDKRVENGLSRNLKKAGLIQVSSNPDFLAQYDVAVEQGSHGFRHQMILQIREQKHPQKIVWCATAFISRMDTPEISKSLPPLITMLTRKFPDVECKMIYAPTGN